MSDNNDEVISQLLASGALEVDGIDSETGEFLYRITDKMERVNKELYDEHINNIYADTMYFWEKGLINFSDFSDTNPTISLTTKAFDPKAIAELPLEKALLFIKVKQALGFFK